MHRLSVIVRRHPVGSLGKIVVAAVALAAGRMAPFSKAEPAPAFDLPRWQTQERVRLDDFSGQILVLDFFAYWCAPCERASKELEAGVQQFYAARNGNAHGVAVRVISVNIEEEFPERTAEFMRKTGISFAVGDLSGRLLSELGGAGIPFLAVVDGSRSQPGKPQFDVIYKHSGFEGTRKLRQIIDGLGPVTNELAIAPVKKEAVTSGRGGSLVQTVEVDSEFAWASDIFLTETTLRYSQEWNRTEWDAIFGYTTFDIDYRPNPAFDANPFREHLDEDRLSAQLRVRQELSETLMLLGSAAGYVGYSDYRRVWIANRYRQAFDHPQFPRVPPYESPDPKGYSFSAGARWEYIPALAFAELTLGYARDQTAPGYEIVTEPTTHLVQGRKRLDTKSLAISSENVLTKRIRALNEFTVFDVSSRELRFSYQGSLNVALSERWVARANGGITTESPAFDAWFFGFSVEYELMRNLLLSLTGRYYQDSGEVFDPSLLSDAAPPLKSWELGVGFRYAWGNSSLKIYAAPFWTDYTPEGVAFEEFRYLYSDRNWGLAQIAYSLQF